MAQKYEVLRDVAQSLVFRKSVPPGESGYIDCDITAHGFVRSVRIRFAAGENGTLHIRPVIILPGNILLDLFNTHKAATHMCPETMKRLSLMLKWRLKITRSPGCIMRISARKGRRIALSMSILRWNTTQ